jgi:myosin-6
MGSLKDPQLDDVQDFAECNEALDQIGLNADDKMNIFKTVATVLHIGNIDFEDDPSSKGGCKVSKAGRGPLQICCKMLGLEESDLESAFVNRVMQAKQGGKTGTAIMFENIIFGQS